jgi:hypothetical protein
MEDAPGVTKADEGDPNGVVRWGKQSVEHGFEG